MKSVLRSVVRIVGVVFSLLIFGLMVSLTFSVLGRVFPDSFVNQVWGLILFDVGAAVWFFMFLAASEGAGQRAVALVLFVVGLMGTLVMVSSEVLLGGQSLIVVGPEVGRAVVYGFIIATAAHLVGVYLHHALSPAVRLSIETQNMRDELADEAMRDASARFVMAKRPLGKMLADGIARDVVSGLNLSVSPELAEQLFGVPVVPVVSGDEEDGASPLEGGASGRA